MIDLQKLMANVGENFKGAQPQRNENEFVKLPQEMYGFKSIYPLQGGKYSLRFLLTKDMKLIRNVTRHQYIINDKFRINAPCLRLFKDENGNQLDCPICNVVKTITDLGKDISQTHRLAKRFISFAHIDSVENKPSGQEISAGENVLFMYPATIASDLEKVYNDCVSNNLSEDQKIANVSKFFQSNNAIQFTISVDKQISQSMYSIMPNVFAGQVNMFSTDEEYNKFIESLPDLDEITFSSTFKEDYRTLAQQVADALSEKFLSGSVEEKITQNILAEDNSVKAINNAQQLNTEQQVNNIINQVQTTTEQPVAQTASTIQSQSSLPECMGKYNELEAKCLICSNSVECAQKSNM